MMKNNTKNLHTQMGSADKGQTIVGRGEQCDIQI